MSPIPNTTSSPTSGTAKIAGLDPQTGRSIEVTAENGIIARIEVTKGETNGETNRDDDLYLSSGFIDLQVNGCAGFDVNAEKISPSTLLGLADAMLANGVTCFAPTLITASEEEICSRLQVIAEARRLHSKLAACVPFVHVEGPSISPLDGYRGAHPADAVRPPSIAEFDRWQDASGGIVGMVTLSPHFDDSPQYISALVKRGIHVALGHTHASPEQIELAIDAGASLSTHLGNGIAQEIPRHRNPIWKQLADDRLAATFIADGHHLPADMLNVMLRAKGIDRSILVSDSVALAGLPAGNYTTPVGGQVELRADGRLCISGSELLAGSTASLARCIGHVARMAITKMPLKHAITMATTNPGRYVGGRGRLIVGSSADLVRFRWSNEVLSDEVLIEDVWLAGERQGPAPSVSFNQSSVRS